VLPIGRTKLNGKTLKTTKMAYTDPKKMKEAQASSDSTTTSTKMKETPFEMAKRKEKERQDAMKRAQAELARRKAIEDARRGR
jgi:hypothetical protein